MSFTPAPTIIQGRVRGTAYRTPYSFLGEMKNGGLGFSGLMRMRLSLFLYENYAVGLPTDLQTCTDLPLHPYLLSFGRHLLG